MARKTAQSMVDDAMEEIVTYTVDEARELHGQDDVVFVDVRDVRELERDGTIPGAFHAPRGMLEFWVDPESPYYKPVFTEGKTYILYCQSDWRGVLAAATLKEMGLSNVFHLAGGYSEWRKAGGATGPRPKSEGRSQKDGDKP